MKKIIYPNENGGLCVVIPTPDSSLTVEQIASKDVPSGVPYKIIEDSDVPTDRTFRDAWEADFRDPDGYGLGHDEWFRLNPSTGDDI